MPRSYLDTQFRRIEGLVAQFDHFAPPTAVTSTQFRADLAGLLVVSIAATYESCVKETLISYASNHHIEFGNFASNNYDRLNSKINLHDLYRYTSLFGDKINNRFSKLHEERKTRINKRIGKNIDASYKLILKWRHDFAHAGIRNTTIEEAMATHRLAKRVLYSFDEAFNG